MAVRFPLRVRRAFGRRSHPCAARRRSELRSGAALPGVFVLCSCSAPTVVGGSPEIEAASSYMRELERWGLSGSLLIAGEAGPLLTGYYGVADPATGTPVTERTVFDIASLSKQFTATAILALQDDGRLDAGDSIGAHLRSVPDDKAAITIHHLLTHTSGLVDPDEPPRPAPTTSEQAVAFILSLPLDDAPGASYAYSNVGYTLLAAIVEVASGTSFADFLRARLFGRAGLESTYVSWDTQIGAPVAVGIGAYEGRFRSGDPRDRPDDWLRRGPGGVLSNVTDLYRWGRAIEEGRILSDRARPLLYEPHTPAEADFLSYGYGWRIQRTPRETGLVWHTGWDEAFSAVYRRYVDENRTVIFLSNTSVDLTPVREVVLRSAREGEIGERLFEGKKTQTLPPTGPPPRIVEGEYVLEGGGRIAVRAEPDALLLSPRDQRGAEALIAGTADAREELETAGARAVALLEGLAASPPALDPEMAAVIDPYGFAGAGVDALAGQMAVLRSELGSDLTVTHLATVPTGLPGRTYPVSTVRLQGSRGTAHYRVIHFAEEEVYVLAGPSAAFERRFVVLADGGAVSVGLLAADTTYLRFVSGTPGDTLGLRPMDAAEWRRATPATPAGGGAPTAPGTPDRPEATRAGDPPPS